MSDFPKPRNYRADIDGLRAIAVGVVVLFHVDFSWVPGGFVGVDVFFVISGFLITRIIQTEIEAGEFSFKRFYIRRARRILPALFFVLILTFVAGFLLHSAEDYAGLGKEIIAATLSVSNLLFLTQAGYFDTASDLEPLLHTWSLAVEEQFYIIWPFLLYFLFNASKNRVFINITIIFIILFSATYYLAGYHNRIAFYLLPFRSYELLIGAICVWIIRGKYNNDIVSACLSYSGIGLVMFSALFFHEGMLWPSYNALVPTRGAAFLIVGGSYGKGVAALSNPAMVKIGIASYSLYLLHWPVVVLYKYSVMRDLNLNEQIAIVASVLVASIFMQKYVERPFRFRNYRKHNRKFILSLASVALFMVGAGIFVISQDGLKWRIGKSEDANYLLALEGCNRPYCESINSPTYDFVMVGDSHSRHHFAGMTAWSKVNKLSFRIYALQECQIWSREYDETACKEEVSNFWKFIEKHNIKKTYHIELLG